MPLYMIKLYYEFIIWRNIMNWINAYEKLVNGKIIESLVSFTRYVIIDNNLYAEKYRINENYITEEEKKGLFREITNFEIENIDIEKELDRTIKQFLYTSQYSELKYNNIINNQKTLFTDDILFSAS